MFFVALILEDYLKFEYNISLYSRAMRTAMAAKYFSTSLYYTLTQRVLHPAKHLGEGLGNVLNFLYMKRKH